MDLIKKTVGSANVYDDTKLAGSVNWTGADAALNGIDFQWLIPLEDIQSKLKWAFSLHVYFFGSTFFVLAFYTFASILNIRSQISRKRFMSGINTFLCIFGVSRAASLFIDPYGSLKVLPVPITNAIWAIGYPSLMSSFALLQLAFLHLTKLKFGAKLLRIEIFLRSVITLHIFSSVLRAVISSIHWSLNVVIINYLCELVFLSWALFIFTSFLYIGYQVFGLLNRVPATMLQPDGCHNKGIMQLVMLAPASNLVTSVTAALMPTLLGPAANMTAASKPTNKFGLASEARTEKQSEQTTRNNPPPGIPSKQGPKPLNRTTKVLEGTKLEVGDLRQEIPVKTKKLTWQSSVTNENKTYSNVIGNKDATNIPTSKRPILKDATKIKVPKVELDAGTVENAVKLPSSTAISNANDKASKENDLLLHTILNHIAYVNRASGGADSGLSHCSHDATPTSRKRQLRFVLKITYSTAILGLLLTLSELFQIFGPYGLLKYFCDNKEISPWMWFTFQTMCRACEIIMSGAIANITKQPAARIHRYYKHNPAMMKQRGSMFM